MSPRPAKDQRAKRSRGGRPSRGARPAAGASAQAASRASGTLRARLAAIGLGAAATLAVAALSLFGWSFVKGPGSGRIHHFFVQPGEALGSLAARLSEAKLIGNARLFVAYARVLNPALALAEGRHVVRDDLSARELLRRLARLPARGQVRLVVPEGFNHLQLAARLEERGVCDAEDFRRAVHDPALLEKLKVGGPSLEGYLFPATYELLADSEPGTVATVLVTEARTRLARLRGALGGAFDARQKQHGLSEHEVVTLASVVEREAARADEKPLIASVFLNRLVDSSFRPLRMLQSDPTAAYGCLVQQPQPTSCSPGRPTPAMLRDASNRYNTYRHAGLPPGPIASPGEGALRAVLEPSATDYLYFVARGEGRHHFSRTFSEHRAVIEQKDSGASP